MRCLKFFQSLLQDQIQSYDTNLKAIEKSENNRSEIIENILNELKKENNKNININLLQSNLMDTRSLIFDQKVIDTMEKILKIKDIFYLDAQIISTQKTKPFSIFIFCLIFIFLILNHSILLKLFKKVFTIKNCVKTITKKKQLLDCYRRSRFHW